MSPALRHLKQIVADQNFPKYCGDSSMTSDEGTKGPVRKESDVYDRQIRLWGAEAQAKMAKAKVLYINITGVTSEIMKNLVLAGIRPALMDSRPFPDAVRTTPSFFWSSSATATTETPENSDASCSNKKLKPSTVAEAVQPVVEELNPLLGACEIATAQTPSELTDDYLATFSVVVASRLECKEAVRISQATVAGGGAFYMVDTFGLNGAAVIDLGTSHQYRPEVGKKLLDPVPMATHVSLERILQVPLCDAVGRFYKTAPPENWTRYRCLLEYATQMEGQWANAEKSIDFVARIKKYLEDTKSSSVLPADNTDEFLTKLAGVATSEVAPVCAVLGGIVGNEVIKVISGKGEPANNTIFMDGLSCKALTFLVQPRE